MSNVNHPGHYNTGTVEVIDAIEDWDLGFNTGNAVKYVARAKHKGKEVEDLQKAAWYINREIDRIQKGDRAKHKGIEVEDLQKAAWYINREIDRIQKGAADDS